MRTTRIIGPAIGRTYEAHDTGEQWKHTTCPECLARGRQAGGLAALCEQISRNQAPHNSDRHQPERYC